MTFTLRPYQQAAVTTALEHFKHDKPFIIQAATGAGKSLLIADICHKLDAPVLILQPSKELLEQNYAKLEQYGIDDIAVYSASMGRKEIGKYVFATIGSIYKKPGLFAYHKYIIIDECDVVNPKELTGMYQKFFAGLNDPRIMGLTATPYRLTQSYNYERHDLYSSVTLKTLTSIGKFWSGGIVSKIETAELIEQKYLSPIKYHADSDDFHDLVVNSTGADYTKDSLERWGSRKMLRIADYATWVHDKCQRNLVFCTSVSQAQSLRSELQERGIESAVVTAETPPKERQAHVLAFRNGSIKHMLNVGVFLAGFDVPALSCIIFARPTMSPRIWYQAVGRGVRLDPERPDKLLRVFDLAGAMSRMGKVETLRLGKAGDGIHDTLVSSKGRLDSRLLYSYRIKTAKRRQTA